MGKEKNALILGTGPSLDQLDVGLLHRFTTFGVNFVHLKFDPANYVVDNVIVADPKRFEVIGKYYQNKETTIYASDRRYVVPKYQKLRHIFGKDFVPVPQLGFERIRLGRFLRKLPLRGIYYNYLLNRREMCFDIKKGVNYGGSVVIGAIQIAAAMGFKRILLHGVDASYAPGKNYFKEGSSHQTSFPKFEQSSFDIRKIMEPMIVLMQLYFEEMDIELIDCTPGGRLRFIHKGRLEDYV